MSGTVVRRTPRERRREQTITEILDAAWRLARRDGLAALSLRELGRQVGLRAQSLYGYFDSKAALYDAMFRQGHEAMRELAAEWDALVDAGGERRAILTEVTEAFMRWCNDDPVRYQLLFQRTIPDWEPSEEAYALAVGQLDRLRIQLQRLGIPGDDAVDMWTALVTGLTSQQLTNDPGGERWIRLAAPAVDMFIDQFGTDADRPRETNR